MAGGPNQRRIPQLRLGCFSGWESPVHVSELGRLSPGWSCGSARFPTRSPTSRRKWFALVMLCRVETDLALKLASTPRRTSALMHPQSFGNMSSESMLPGQVFPLPVCLGSMPDRPRQNPDRLVPLPRAADPSPHVKVTILHFVHTYESQDLTPLLLGSHKLPYVKLRVI